LGVATDHQGVVADRQGVVADFLGAASNYQGAITDCLGATTNHQGATDLAAPWPKRLSLPDMLIVEAIDLDVWIFTPTHGGCQLSWFVAMN
jgi:hypothetical protein